MLCMLLTYCIWKKSFVYVCKLFVCSERIYRNRLKLVERGQRSRIVIILLKTGFVFFVLILTKWKLKTDFICEILSLFLHLTEILCILNMFSQENHISCWWLLSALVLEKRKRWIECKQANTKLIRRQFPYTRIKRFKDT